MRTKLEIRDEVEDVVGYLDIGEDADFPFTLTKSLASLRNISKRGGAYSKTFKVPSTKENNKLLHYLYSSNQKVVKGFRKRKAANIFVDNVVIERGYVKITDIEIKNGTEYYVMTFFGDNVKWMTDLAEITLKDLDYSNNSQTYNESSIRASWDKVYGDGYDHVYPFICYGAHKDGTGLQVEDFYPAIRYRAIIERSLNHVGYTLSSDFMDTADFKQLIFPFIGGSTFKLSQATVDDRLFRAEANNYSDHSFESFHVIAQNFYLQIATPITFNNDSTGANFDNGGNFNTTTHRFTAPVRGKYRFATRVFVIAPSSDTSNSPYSVYISLHKYVPLNNDIAIRADILIVGDTPELMTRTTNEGGIYVETGYYQMEAGDEVFIGVEYPFFVGGSLRIGAGSSFKLLDQKRDLADGDIYDLNTVMPNIKILELFADITKLFNLYWLTDSKTKTVYVETRDDFFTGITNAVDWTKRLAIDKDHTIKFLTDYKRELLFKYKEDSKDGYLKKRNEAFQYANNLFCSYKHTFSDRFPKGEDNMECKLLAPTYILEDQDVTKPDSPPYAITSRMWKDASIGHPVKSLDFSPRILNYQYDTQVINGINCNMTFEGIAQTTIPSALAIQVYGNTVPYSLSFAQEDGLFSNYYKSTIAVIQDGIQLVAYFKMTANDYQTLDFRKPIYLNNPEEVQGYWIIDTISDFSPFKPLTKVTLLKYHNFDYLGMIGNATEINDEWAPPPFPDDEHEDENYTGGDYEFNDGTDVSDKVIGTGSLDLDSNYEDGEVGAVVIDPEMAGIQLLNGTGNLALIGSGSLAIGQGCEAHYPGQTMMGSFPEITDDIVAIGVGTKSERITGLRMTADGDVTIYGGEIYILNGEGNMIPVTIEPNGKVKKIYLK